MYNITLHSTGCPQCNVLKRKLAAKGITYEENNDVEKMVALGIEYVPVLQVNDTLMDFLAACKWVDAEETD